MAGVWFGNEYVRLFDGINVYPTFSKPVFNGHTGYVLKRQRAIVEVNNSLGFLDILMFNMAKKGQSLIPEKVIIASDKNGPANKIFKRQNRFGMDWVSMAMVCGNILLNPKNLIIWQR
ncbi:MAG: hypothetical protein IPN79_20000 [Saprospiraceae bacterium]|nr:hypothetical protein [Saprospiraceae bacterium]